MGALLTTSSLRTGALLPRRMEVRGRPLSSSSRFSRATKSLSETLGWHGAGASTYNHGIAYILTSFSLSLLFAISTRSRFALLTFAEPPRESNAKRDGEGLPRVGQLLMAESDCTHLMKYHGRSFSTV